MSLLQTWKKKEAEAEENKEVEERGGERSKKDIKGN